MEVEESKSIDEFNNDGFVIDPVEIILPKSYNAGAKPSARKSKSSAKKKKQNTEMTDAPSAEVSEFQHIKELYKRLAQVIERTKEDILDSKILKISKKLWSIVQSKKERISPFTIVKVNIPSNYQELLRAIYMDFNKECPEDMSGAIIDIEQPIPNLRDLIETSTKQLGNLQEMGTDGNNTIVILFHSHLNLYQEFLDDYMKYMNEEVISERPNTKIFLVFSALTAHIGFKDLEAHIVELKFANTRKLIIQLLLNLIGDKSFFPFIGSKALKFLTHDLDYMNISFERMVQKIHLLVQDYLFSIRDNDFALTVVTELLDADEAEESELTKYFLMKKQFVEALEVFHKISRYFDDKKKVAEYIVDLLMSGGETSYQIPSNVATNTYEELSEICSFIESTIGLIENPDYLFFVKKFGQLKNIEEAQKITSKSKSKEDSRQDRLLSKGKGRSKKNEERENLSAIRKELGNYLKMFMKQFIHGSFCVLEERFPKIVYNDTERLSEICYTDILERYCRSFRDTPEDAPRKEMSMMFRIIQDFSFRINTSQSYESFVDMYKKAYPDIDKEDIPKVFFVTLNELKWMGMLNETRKSQISFEKNFFAKALYRKPGVDADDQDDIKV